MLKKSKSKSGWLRLLVYENWGTTFYLIPQHERARIVWNTPRDKYQQLSMQKSYDVKLLNGKTYMGCGISIDTHHSRGMGGMSEDSSSSEAFFHAEGLTIKLKSGYLMRVNQNVTARRNGISRRREIDEKLAELLLKEKEVKKEIANLLKKRR